MEKSTLIEAIKENAKYFLEEAGEFFPFAVCVNEDDQFVPIYLDEEEEFDSDESMVEELKFCVTKAIEEESFISGAIAYDAVINQEGTEQDAIRIIFFESGMQQISEDYAYTLKNKKVLFQ
jgi:hypothetical protein